MKYISIIILLCCLVYAGSLTGGFISDDVATIKDNPDIGIFPQDLSSIMNWASYKLSGLNTITYHIFSLLVHIIASVLAFFFLCHFFGRKASFIAALIFACHPVHTEAVSWISGRPYAIGAALIFGSFLLYLRATKDKLKVIPYLLSLLLCLNNAGWYLYFYPLMLIAYDTIFKRKKWLFWLPYIGVIGVRVITNLAPISQRIGVLKNPLVTGDGTNNPIFKFAYSFFEHLVLLLYPINLTLYHEPNRITPWLITVEVCVLFIALFFLPRFFRKSKRLFFALILFILFLMPTYSPLLISWTVAERYLYLPSIALCMVFASLLERHKAMLLVAMVLIGAYSMRTVSRNEDWHNRERLWRATVKASPQSHKAHNNMGDVYSKKGNVLMSLWSFKKAVTLRPAFAEAWHNLGFTYWRLGKAKEAIAGFKKALELNPNQVQSSENLRDIYRILKKNE